MNDIPKLCIVGGLPLESPGGHPSRFMGEAWHACGGQVLYAQIPASPWSRKPLQEKKAGLWCLDLPPSFGMPRTWPDFWRRRLVRQSGAVIDRSIKSCGFLSESVVYLYYGWFWEELAGRPALAHIYDCIDDSSSLPHVACRNWMVRYVREREQGFIRKVDAVAATSPVLAEFCRRGSGRVEMLPNGVDLDCWQAGSQAVQLPSKLASLPRPRMVLFGNLQSKLDYGLVGDLAAALPEKGFALIGPKMDDVTLPQETDNLHWHDGVRLQVLSTWMPSMDVGLVPLLDTPFNRASCPLKVLEYMGSGLPVVASRIPITEYWQQRFPGRIFLADNSVDEWAFALEKALGAGRQALASEEAESLTWTARARRLSSLVHEVVGRQGGGSIS